MKNYILNNKLVIALIFVIVLLIIIFTTSDRRVEPKLNKTTNHIRSSIIDESEFTCTYKQTTQSTYDGSVINQEIPPEEKNPMIFTFSNLLVPEKAQISFIDSTRTINTNKVIVVYNSAEKIILIQGTGDPYLTIHTIYKKEGISTYSKDINILGTIIQTSSVGVCL